MIVDILRAIVTSVQFENFSLIFFYTKTSVSKSTFAVASSKTIILALLRIALAKHRSCFWPTEKVDCLKGLSNS